MGLARSTPESEKRFGVEHFIRSTSSDQVGRRIERAIFIAAVATVPQTLVHLLGMDGGVLTTIDWLLWTIFLADLLTLLAWSGPSALATPRGIIGLVVVVLSLPTWPALLALTRLARLAAVEPARG